MSKKNEKEITTKFAIVYDFDGTLAPGNMQEYSFIPEIGMKSEDFWQEVNEEAKKQRADNILVYMQSILLKAKEKNIKITKEKFREYGTKVKFFDGLEVPDGKKNWFDRINDYARNKNIAVEHYIISSGIYEIIQGTSIQKEFERIYASSYCYDNSGEASWPSVGINYTTKTQYLFRINKGIFDLSDHDKINEYYPKEKRRIHFKNIIFIGDGETDIPCFGLVRDQGGYSIAVYDGNKQQTKEKVNILLKDKRVEFVCEADYMENSAIDRTVKAIIDKSYADKNLENLKADLIKKNDDTQPLQE